MRAIGARVGYAFFLDRRTGLPAISELHLFKSSSRTSRGGSTYGSRSSPAKLETPEYESALLERLRACGYEKKAQAPEAPGIATAVRLRPASWALDLIRHDLRHWQETGVSRKQLDDTRWNGTHRVWRQQQSRRCCCVDIARRLLVRLCMISPTRCQITAMCASTLGVCHHEPGLRSVQILLGLRSNTTGLLSIGGFVTYR